MRVLSFYQDDKRFNIFKGLRVLGSLWFAFSILLISCGGKVGVGVHQEDRGYTPKTTPLHDIIATSDTEYDGLLPLFDAHAHQIPNSYPEGWLETLFADNNPMGIVLMGIGNVLEHQEHYPNKALAFSNFKDLNINFSKINSQLEEGFFGIGEVSIRHFASGHPGSVAAEHDFNDPDLLILYNLAQEHMVPVIFHFDFHRDHVSELTDTLILYPTVTFIWAHAGDAQPDQIRPLLEAHNNLHLDISSRNPLESFKGRLTSLEIQRLDERDGTIKTAWRDLFNDFADRVYYGSDIGPQGRLEQYAEIQKYYRGILGQLDPEVAEKIAYKNALVIFGLGGP